MFTSRYILFFLAFVVAIAAALPIQKASPNGNLTTEGDFSKSESEGKLASLLPFPHTGNFWTTTSGYPNALPLSDSTFRPTHEITSLPPKYVEDPSGLMSMEASFPKGSYTFNHKPQGGLSFYAPGPLRLKDAREIIFAYSVLFQEGFDWNKGGKLPGIYGGDTAEGSIGCSGGRHSVDCFSIRYMFREDGAGELYTYLPNYEANKVVCDVKPMSECNPKYGASIGRGSFTFVAGQRTILSVRARLNTPGTADGELEVAVNGKSVINIMGLMLRDSDEGQFRGIMWQTFFGGHDASYASPKFQRLWLSDATLAISEYFKPTQLTDQH